MEYPVNMRRAKGFINPVLTLCALLKPFLNHLIIFFPTNLPKLYASSNLFERLRLFFSRYNHFWGIPQFILKMVPKRSSRSIRRALQREESKNSGSASASAGRAVATSSNKDVYSIFKIPYFREMTKEHGRSPSSPTEYSAWLDEMLNEPRATADPAINDARKTQGEDETILEVLTNTVSDFFYRGLMESSTQWALLVRDAVAGKTKVDMRTLALDAEDKKKTKTELIDFFAKQHAFDKPRVIVSLILLLASPPGSVETKKALSFMKPHQKLNGLSVRDVEGKTSENLPARFAAAKRDAVNGKIGKTTVLGVHLMDRDRTRQDEMNIRYPCPNEDSFDHGFVIAVSREGWRLYQGWGGGNWTGTYSFRLDQWVMVDGTRHRSWDEGKEWMRKFERLLSPKKESQPWTEEMDELYMSLFMEDFDWDRNKKTKFVSWKGRIHSFNPTVRICEVSDVQLANLTRFTFLLDGFIFQPGVRVPYPEGSSTSPIERRKKFQREVSAFSSDSEIDTPLLSPFEYPLPPCPEIHSTNIIAYKGEAATSRRLNRSFSMFIKAYPDSSPVVIMSYPLSMVRDCVDTGTKIDPVASSLSRARVVHGEYVGEEYHGYIETPVNGRAVRAKIVYPRPRGKHQGQEEKAKDSASESSHKAMPFDEPVLEAWRAVLANLKSKAEDETAKELYTAGTTILHNIQDSETFKTKLRNEAERHFSPLLANGSLFSDGNEDERLAIMLEELEEQDDKKEGKPDSEQWLVIPSDEDIKSSFSKQLLRLDMIDILFIHVFRLQLHGLKNHYAYLRVTYPFDMLLDKPVPSANNLRDGFTDSKRIIAVSIGGRLVITYEGQLGEHPVEFKITFRDKWPAEVKEGKGVGDNVDENHMEKTDAEFAGKGSSTESRAYEGALKKGDGSLHDEENMSEGQEEDILHLPSPPPYFESQPDIPCSPVADGEKPTATLILSGKTSNDQEVVQKYKLVNPRAPEKPDTLWVTMPAELLDSPQETILNDFYNLPFSQEDRENDLRIWWFEASVGDYNVKFRLERRSPAQDVVGAIGELISEVKGRFDVARGGRRLRGIDFLGGGIFGSSQGEGEQSDGEGFEGQDEQLNYKGEDEQAEEESQEKANQTVQESSTGSSLQPPEQSTSPSMSEEERNKESKREQGTTTTEPQRILNLIHNPNQPPNPSPETQSQDKMPPKPDGKIPSKPKTEMPPSQKQQRRQTKQEKKREKKKEKKAQKAREKIEQEEARQMRQDARIEARVQAQLRKEERERLGEQGSSQDMPEDDDAQNSDIKNDSGVEDNDIPDTISKDELSASIKDEEDQTTDNQPPPPGQQYVIPAHPHTITVTYEPDPFAHLPPGTPLTPEQVKIYEAWAKRMDPAGAASTAAYVPDYLYTAKLDWSNARFAIEEEHNPEPKVKDRDWYWDMIRQVGDPYRRTNPVGMFKKEQDQLRRDRVAWKLWKADRLEILRWEYDVRKKMAEDGVWAGMARMVKRVW
ncbi:hypothetical protein BDV19DRAFT_390829 [Aspergillus venezuelensis]